MDFVIGFSALMVGPSCRFDRVDTPAGLSWLIAEIKFPRPK
jgi:hypothetical protein